MPLLAARARAATAATEVDVHETRVLIAIASIAAGLVHAVVVPEHLGDGWAHGAFFILAATFQFAWAFALLQMPSRAVLRAGIWSSLALAALWAVSRTVGVPVGPGAWTPEAVGPLDVLATYDELLIAGGCALLLTGADAWRLHVLRGLATGLVVVTLTALFLGGGHHGH